MAGEKQLFRKKALAKLASPEQLDTLMQVTEPRGWLALGGIGVFCSLHFARNVTMGKSSCVGFSGLLNILHDGNVSDPFLLGIGQGYHCQLDFWSNFAIVFNFTSQNEYFVPLRWRNRVICLRRPNSSTHSVF